MTNPKDPKEIDRIVDEIEDDPAKAERLKDALHPDQKKTDTKPEITETGEDLWDNMPV